MKHPWSMTADLWRFAAESRESHQNGSVGRGYGALAADVNDFRNVNFVVQSIVGTCFVQALWYKVVPERVLRKLSNTN